MDPKYVNPVEQVGAKSTLDYLNLNIAACGAD
jgi:hypothetical protein